MTLNNIRSITSRMSMGGYVTLDNWWHGENVIIDDSKLFYITDGEIIIEIDGAEMRCGAGDLVLVPASTRHSFHLPENMHASKYWFHFSLCTEGDSVFDRYELPLCIKVRERDRTRIEELFSSVISDGEGDAVWQCKKMSAVCELSYYFLSNCEKKEKHRFDRTLDSVIRYINENIRSDISLAELASVACLSPNYLARRFTEKLGTSPLRYVHMLRMEKAKKMLFDGESRIAEVMREIGFDDPSYFSRAFKAYTGYSPRVYKNSMSQKMQGK